MSPAEDNIIPFEQETEPRQSGLPMKSDLVEQASAIIQDPQVLVNVVSKRVEQLNRSERTSVERLPNMGLADIALKEIIEGKLKVKTD